ncbi:hypothetical protein RUM43_000133 [Polyplax serrata]|uniref:Uncharacterized protein n=1 Tax=Polyplax serrata TaxID=468196 RepID=A0AAN8XNI5_POLSC
MIYTGKKKSTKRDRTKKEDKYGTKEKKKSKTGSGESWTPEDVCLTQRSDICQVGQIWPRGREDGKKYFLTNYNLECRQENVRVTTALKTFQFSHVNT